MSGRELDESWKAWLRENIARRCDPDELRAILIQHEFSLAAIAACMGEHFPVRSPLTTAPKGTHLDHAALSHVRLTRLPAAPGLWRFPSDEIQFYTLDDFLSAADCAAVVTMIRNEQRPSTITREDAADPYFRTSSTSDLSLLRSDIVEALDNKIATTLGVRPAYAEGLQGQHYAVGQEFKAHTDFFEPGSPEYAEFGGARGNRTWTFMVYLNEVPRGGGTYFPKLAHLVQPRIGQAVIWNNLHIDGTPNDKTLHAGLPVEEGEKFVITKWFRENGAGPMFT